jgi:hypothetical protein
MDRAHVAKNASLQRGFAGSRFLAAMRETLPKKTPGRETGRKTGWS